MKMHYSLPRLSERERELMKEVLLEEMDMQCWFSVAFSAALDRELIILIQ